jgi:diguanylate cyclase (GGDEF)-like protein
MCLPLGADHHMPDKPTKVLVIEDDQDYTRLLQVKLSKATSHPFDVECTDTLEVGLQHLAKGSTEVILLDLLLPDSRGLDTFLRVQMQSPETPVVVLTGFDDDTIALEAVRKGAQDYLVKGQAIDGKMLSRVIRYAIERQQMQSALRSLALVDELTALYNRRGFTNLATQHLKLAQRTKRSSLLLLLDVDKLKHINDTLGHPAGDRALVDVADILRGTFRTSDVIARIGGDEFAVIAIEAHKDSGEMLTARLQEKLKEHNARPNRSYQLSLSVGVACLDPESQKSFEDLMATADRSLYECKRALQTP